MKKIKLLSLALIAVFNLCSCEDDDTQSFTETDIAGTWELIEYEVTDGNTTTSIAEQSFEQNYTQVGSNFDYTLTLSTDPNLSSAEGSYDVLTTYDDGSSETTPIFIDESTVSEWFISGSSFVSVEGDEEFSAEILELNDTTLKLRLDLSQISNTDLLNNPSLDFDNSNNFDFEGFEGFDFEEFEEFDFEGFENLDFGGSEDITFEESLDFEFEISGDIIMTYSRN